LGYLLDLKHVHSFGAPYIYFVVGVFVLVLFSLRWDFYIVRYVFGRSGDGFKILTKHSGTVGRGFGVNSCRNLLLAEKIREKRSE